MSPDYYSKCTLAIIMRIYRKLLKRNEAKHYFHKFAFKLFHYNYNYYENADNRFLDRVQNTDYTCLVQFPGVDKS